MTPIIPAHADPIDYLQSMIRAYYTKNWPSRLPAANDEGPDGPAVEMAA